MQPFEFFTQSSRDPDNRWAHSARLLNCYREPAGDGRICIKGVLGTTEFADTEAIFCRAMEYIGGQLYAVFGGKLFRINAVADVAELGTVEDSPETTISGNNGDITVVAGGSYYRWDGSALTTPAAGAFNDFGSVTFFGQLTVLTERNGRRVQWSDVADASTLGGLNFATTESRDDNNLRAQPIGGELWIFKERSIERWYQDGTGLAAIPGSTLDVGLKSFRLLTQMGGGGAFFIGDDNKAYIAPDMAPVSTVPVDTSIVQNNPTECLYYEDEGRKFCIINFDDRPAWVLDVTSGEWHERGEGPDFEPWSVQAASLGFGGKWYLGGYTGKVLRLDRTGADHNAPLVRQATGRTVSNGGRRFRVPEMRIEGRMGAFATEPRITLEVSGDYGFTWGDEIEEGLGEIGEYAERVVFRQLGSFRQFTPRLSWSGAQDFVLDAAPLVRFG